MSKTREQYDKKLNELLDYARKNKNIVELMWLMNF